MGESNEAVLMRYFAERVIEKLDQKNDAGVSGWGDVPVDAIGSQAMDQIIDEKSNVYVNLAAYCMMLHERGASPSLLREILHQKVADLFSDDTF